MCKVIAITNRKLCRGNFLEQIRVLCLAGIDRIVLREKDLEESEYEALARQVLAVCAEYKTECFLHQNVAVAKRLGAGNIHLSVPAALEHREELDAFDRLGISVHSLEQLAEAVRCGANDVFYGHVFQTDCKKGVPPRGAEALREICARAKFPVYAIGGISPENAVQAVEAGAGGVCVMSWGMQQDEESIRVFVEQCHGLG